MSNSMLSLESLNIFVNKNQIVKNLNFSMDYGEILGIVGGSGSGKTVTALSIMNLLPHENFLVNGDIIFDGVNLCELSNKKRRSYLGNEISMIFQDPMVSLNPLMRVGEQISEPLKIHFKKMRKKDIYTKTIETMESAELKNPENIYKKYPHELSGGLRQRVMIAMALICSPKLLIADEPTTALDVVTQKEILDELKNISKQKSVGIMLISHDLAVIKYTCQNVVVLYDGEILEKGEVLEVLKNPKSDYTKSLLKAIPTPSKKGREL